MAKLFVHKHGKLLGEVELDHGATTIGRRPDNDIALSDRTVSGRHARIHLSHGRATLQDLGSTNGTCVNGKRIATHALDDGDMIAIGNYRLGFDGGGAGTVDAGAPTQILRLDKPGMPPAPVDARSTRRIRKWRPGNGTDQAVSGAERRACLRIVSGCNQGRHLDLLAPVTAIGEPGHEVVVLIRRGDDLLIRVVHVASGRVLVNDAPLADEAITLRHNDVIMVGDVRMIVVLETTADEAGAGTENWTLE